MIGASKATSTREYQVLSTTTFTSSGAQSFTIPSGVVFLEVEMYGGGGGGGKGQVASGRGGSSHRRGGGGGGGSYVKHRIRVTDLRKDDTINFTVGGGGAAGTSLSDPGNDGGDTTLDTHKRGSDTITTFSSITAGGGEGGRSAQTFAGDYSGGGVATGGNITNTNGSDGEPRAVQSTAYDGGNGGDAGGPDGGDGRNGGTAASLGTPATNGDAPGGGAGGGGSEINTSGAVGGVGRVIIKAFG